MAVADVMKMVKDNEVKFVDFRFTDTRGKEQHVSVPTKAFTEEKFTDGHAFDGSSIAGWKGIEHLDRYDNNNALVLRKGEAGALTLESLPLP